MLQFWAGNLYLVGNRNLHEFTLTLKDYSRASDILESYAENEGIDDNLDETANLNTITELIKRSKEVSGSRDLSKREVVALEML